MTPTQHINALKKEFKKVDEGNLTDFLKKVKKQNIWLNYYWNVLSESELSYEDEIKIKNKVNEMLDKEK